MFWEVAAYEFPREYTFTREYILCNSISVDEKAYNLQLKLNSNSDLLGGFSKFSEQ